MSNPLINPVILEIPVKIPPATIRTHFSTAIASSSEWFQWSDVKYDEDNNPYLAKLTYWQHGNERKLVTMEFSDRDFFRGLRQYLKIHGTTETVQYYGDGEFDIDALGADAIVQYAVYEELLLS